MRAIFLIFVGLLHAYSANAQEAFVLGEGRLGESVWASDLDGDLIADNKDQFPNAPIGNLTDTDADGAPNNCDQACIDSGMRADADDDNDGVADSEDAFPLDPAETVDTDGDGTGNNADLDDDGDGYADNLDAFPIDPLEHSDNDDDGIGDVADDDDDNDAITDADEILLGRSPTRPEYVFSTDNQSASICLLDGERIPRCWGSNSYGQIQPPTSTAFKQISLGERHGCGITLSDTVSCWGDNAYGQASPPENLDKVKQLTSANRYSCALLEDDSITCWGGKYYMNPLTFSGAKKIVSGWDHSCVLHSGGISCFGSTGSEQIPSDLSGSYTDVHAANDFVCSEDSTGSTSCYGIGKDIYYDVTSETNINNLTVGSYNYCSHEYGYGLACGGSSSFDILTPPLLNARIGTLALTTTMACVLTSTGVTCWGTGANDAPEILFDNDQDGVNDIEDAFPLDAAESIDTDNDGIGNNTDLDDDNDGYSDAYELEKGTDPLDATDFKPLYDDLNGIVYHWSQHSLMNAAEIHRISDAEVKSATNAQGRYRFEDTPEGNYELSASQAVTDADINRTITSADALAALKIAVGLNPNSDPDGDGPLEALAVSPYQLISADMNQDGRVTSADALAILKVAVGLSDALEPSWKLVADAQSLWSTHGDKSNVFDASKAYLLTYPDKTEVNFAAILLGDVNPTWKPQEGTESLNHDHFSMYAKASGAPLSLWGIRDSDEDGLSDEQEETLGTSPLEADTDADGVNDVDDLFPLDPDKSDDIPVGAEPEPVLLASPMKANTSAITMVKPVLLRGDMNDWGVSDTFDELDDGTYQLVMKLTPGTYTFKVASANWSIMDLGAQTETHRLIKPEVPTLLSSEPSLPYVLVLINETTIVFKLTTGEHKKYYITVFNLPDTYDGP
ncbi:OmpA-like transmembrane domain protein [Aequoribacter fuscus]|uniref:non-specific serine/threonine protein kinase n=1 Tax=Aequoribacter fuscus TaxID=2518989 RepID=F3L3Y2_9GAMM|nr:outer membrane protein OmpA [Aequoribacter fuscus]EGG28965.1 OmpA-like transmembrane domain protein [Aequoribacter fuscus]QHJ87992.1 hypothetical protein EYZ66_06625 [Aequoribacter fuscus]